MVISRWQTDRPGELIGKTSTSMHHFITDMKCGGCRLKVANVLDGNPAVRRWDVDLNDPHKRLSVDLRPGTEPAAVTEWLKEAGIRAVAQPPDDHPSDDPATTAGPATNRRMIPWRRYKPLLLVLLYVAGLTGLTEQMAGGWVAMRAMSRFMGFFFLGFAFFKLLDVGKFADAFATYDPIARRSRAYAIMYPWIEMTLGILFVTGRALMVANLAVIVLLGIGLIGVIAAVRKRQAIQCACLGTAFNLPMSSITIVENSVMIAMATIMLVIHR